MQQRLYFGSILLILVFFFTERVNPTDHLTSEAPVPSFQKEVMPIIQQKCATTVCHGGPQRPSFTDYESIEKKAKRIEKRVGHEKRPMPPLGAGIELSASEIKTIQDWIAAGAPNN